MNPGESGSLTGPGRGAPGARGAHGTIIFTVSRRATRSEALCEEALAEPSRSVPPRHRRRTVAWWREMKRPKGKRDSARRMASKRGLWRTPPDQGIEALARAALERISAEHAQEAAKGLVSEAERLRSQDDLSDQGAEGVEGKAHSRDDERDRTDAGELLDKHARDLALLAERAEDERVAADEQVAALAETLQERLVQAQRDEGARIRAELTERLDEHAKALSQESAGRHEEAERRMIAAVDAWVQGGGKRLERAGREALSAAETRIL